MADRVDAAMDQMKPAAGNPMSDCAATDTGREQLRPRHHAVLSFGKGCNQTIYAPSPRFVT
jgi:hypothetical protein